MKKIIFGLATAVLMASTQVSTVVGLSKVKYDEKEVIVKNPSLSVKSLLTIKGIEILAQTARIIKYLVDGVLSNKNGLENFYKSFTKDTTKGFERGKTVGTTALDAMLLRSVSQFLETQAPFWVNTRKGLVNLLKSNVGVNKETKSTICLDDMETSQSIIDNSAEMFTKGYLAALDFILEIQNKLDSKKVAYIDLSSSSCFANLSTEGYDDISSKLRQVTDSLGKLIAIIGNNNDSASQRVVGILNLVKDHVNALQGVLVVVKEHINLTKTRMDGNLHASDKNLRAAMNKSKTILSKLTKIAHLIKDSATKVKDVVVGRDDYSYDDDEEEENVPPKKKNKQRIKKKADQ